MAYSDKSFALTTRYQGASFEHDFKKHKKSLVAEPLGCALRTWPRVRVNDEPRVSRPEVRHDGKSNALTSVSKDSMVCEPVRIGQLEGLSAAQANRIYSVEGKSVCLNANGGGGGAKTGLYRIDLPDGDYTIRKLTPVECERLQTLPDNYSACVSNTQRYKAIGNGWTVDVITHIFSFMEGAGEVNYCTTFDFFEWCKSFKIRA